MELDPQWVVGFVDGEGCFYVDVNPHQEMAIGYQVLPEFRVVQHERDVQVLYSLKRFFHCGVVRRNHEDRYELRIRKLSCLLEVVAFFERYPLKTKKQVDFRKFAQIIRMMTEKRHLAQDGLEQIIDITLTMNRADKQKAATILQDLHTKTG